VPAGRRALLVDALLYAGSAVFAFWTLRYSFLQTHRVWADFALPGYGVAAVAVLLVGFAARRGLALPRVRQWRAAIMLVAFTGAVLLPLIVEIALRAHRGSGYAQSETLVTEHAARSLVHGHNPYSATFTDGSLYHHPPRFQQHFPYLPLMAVFGLASAIHADVAWSDARICFALAAFAAAGAALALWRTTPERRLRVFLVLLVLPTAAPFLVTGGDDIVVLALMLFALVLARQGRSTAASVTIGVAALLKLTAWPLLLALPATYTTGLRRWRAPLVVAVLLLPAALWSPGAFVEDNFLYPLGLGHGGTKSHAPTVGFFVVKDFTHGPLALGRAVLTIALLAVATAFGLWLLRGKRLREPADAARAAGVLLFLLFALAPVGRLGYVTYPVNLLLWSVVLRKLPAQRFSTSACLERTASAASRNAESSASVSGNSTISLIPPAPSRAGTPR
jgi:hypothetical protein